MHPKHSTLLLSWLFCILPQFVNAQFNAIDSSWQIADIGGGTKPSFDFDSQGNLHVMAMTEAISGKVWYATAANLAGPWSPQDVATGYFYGPGDLLVDKQDSAHLAWHDHDEQDAGHFVVNEDGTSSRTRVATIDTHDGWDNSLALSQNGELVMASIDPTGFGATSSLLVSNLTNGSWTSEKVTESHGVMYGLNTSIVIDGDNQAQVLYTNAQDWAGPGAIVHAKQEPTGAWKVSEIESGQNVGRFPSLAIGSDDRLHAAWINIHNDDQSQADVRYATLDNGWNIETVATLQNVKLGFANARKLVSLALDSQDNPHLAYGDTKTVNYLTRTGSDWTETRVVAADAELNGLVVLRLGPDDQPAITFWRPFDSPDDGIVSLAMLEIQQLLGDFNDDKTLSAIDIDLLSAAIGGADLSFDLNGDSMLNNDDRAVWIDELAKVRLGDADFNGNVEFADFLSLSSAFGENGGWANGDFDGTGTIDFSDFLLLSINFGEENTTASVPEPLGATARLIGVLALACICRMSRLRTFQPMEKR